MLFPPYRLAAFQAEYAAKADFQMGASAAQALTLQELLSLADETELKPWHALSLGYSSSQGDGLLRETIAEFYPGLDSSHIITFAGAQEAIFVACHALLHPGDRIQVILPLFEPLSLVAEGIGARVDAVELQAQAAGGWRLDLDRWRDAVHASTRMAMINFPHNPTGSLISAQELQQMVEHCERNDCWLFSDEVFRGLEYRPDEQLPPVASLSRKGLSLGVMSKAYGLPGVRVGWIACRDTDLIARMLEIKRYLSICNGRTDEQLATIALRHAPEILRRSRATIQGNLHLLKTKLASFDDTLQWLEPDAGCVAFPRLKQAMTATVFAQGVLERAGVMLIPGACFRWDDTHVRVGFGQSNFAKALQRFVALPDLHPGEPRQVGIRSVNPDE